MALAQIEEMVSDSDTRVVGLSLTAESARDVRISRIVASAPKIAERARLQGYYDHLMGKPSRAADLSKALEISYLQGVKKAAEYRALLKGRPWMETSIVKAGSQWAWSIFKEGFHAGSGTATSQTKAYDAAFVARLELAEAGQVKSPTSMNGDATAPSSPATQASQAAEDAEAAEATRQPLRMRR